MDAKKGLHGYCGETVNAEKDPCTGTVARHIQLPGTASAREGGERSAPVGSAVAEPHEWHAPGSPTREEHLAALERPGSTMTCSTAVREAMT